MIFTTNTKPLDDALSLSIINGNISNYDKRSTVVELSFSSSGMSVNVEASGIKTQVDLLGSYEGPEGRSTLFVSSSLFKQLVSSIDTSTISFEYDPNGNDGLIVRSGKSKFTVPRSLDIEGLEFNKPTSENSGEDVKISEAEWKYVKDHQMYAISMSFVHKVYTQVWVGNSGDVIVGDYDNGLFTKSNVSKLGESCLLKDTIINLLISLPEKCSVVRFGRSYVISFATDSFKYVSEFTPSYEDDPDMGTYNSDIFLGMMNIDDQKLSESFSASTSEILKYLGQALIFADGDSVVRFTKADDVVRIVNKNIDCVIPIKTTNYKSFEVIFEVDRLRKVISTYDESESVNMYPLASPDDPEAVSGLLFWNDKLVTMMAGLE